MSEAETYEQPNRYFGIAQVFYRCGDLLRQIAFSIGGWIFTALTVAVRGRKNEQTGRTASTTG